MRSSAAVLAVATALAPWASATWTRGVPGELSISVDETASASPPYSVSVGGTDWLHGQLPQFHCNQQWLSPASGLSFDGYEMVGQNSLTWAWRAGALRFNTTFTYNALSQTFEFHQVYPSGCPRSNLTAAPVAGPAAGDALRDVDRARARQLRGEFGAATRPLSMFPSFNTSSGAAPSLRYYSWRGRFMHDHDERGAGLAGFQGGQEGGPLLVHEDKADGSASALVLSPLSGFMSGMLARVGACSFMPRSNSCTIENNTDYMGNDVVMHSGVKSVGECCDLCKANPACTAFSWADERDPSYEYDCWLKDSTAGRTQEKHTSGYLCDDSREPSVLAAGVQGQVQAVPGGFVQSFVISALPGQGVTAAMYKWGAAMRESRNTTRLQNDIVSRKLAYGTDNGGYFYGNNVPNAENLTVTMQALRKAGVDVASVQLDPFWYPDGDSLTSNCAVEWEPRKDLWPQGLEALSQAVDAPLILYSALWCTDTAAVPEYQGFRFVNSTDFNAGFDKGVFSQADPSTSRAFYDHIMQRQSAVLGGFETDFMDFSALLVPDFVTTVDAAHGWLKGMWGAAEARGVSAQQCMSLPSMILESLDFPAATNARASEDDFPTNQNRWQIGYTGLFLGPVAVRPFFDVLWTAADQPGNPYRLSHRVNVRRDVQVATLSQGPIWIGDGPGMTDVDVVRSFAARDSTLLHPSRPATPVDAMLAQTGRPAGSAEVWSTYTTSGSAGDVTSHVVFALDVAEPFDLPLGSLWPASPRPVSAADPVSATWVPAPSGPAGPSASPDATSAPPVAAPAAAPVGLFAMNDTAGCADGGPAAACTTYVPASQDTLRLMTGGQSPSGEHSTSVVTIVPERAPGLAFAGLEGPVVRLSPQRVASVTMASDAAGLSVTVTGVPGEAVRAWFVVPGQAEGAGPVMALRSGTVGSGGTVVLTSSA